MKISEAIKLKGKPLNIPDCSRDDLPGFFKEMGYETGAEIGVYKGAFTEKFCKEGLNMYAIDPWVAFYGQGRTEAVQERQDFLYRHTVGVLAPYKNCTVVRKTSADALEDFADESLDFVYIDGNHEFSYVAHDIYEWNKKVRVGGVVSGHDYYCTDPNARNLVCHVGPAVDACVRVLGVENFYTFGRTKPLEEEAKNDLYLSWLWIKG